MKSEGTTWKVFYSLLFSWYNYSSQLRSYRIQMLITLGWGHCSKVFAISIHFNVLADKLKKIRLLDGKSSFKVLLFPLMLQTRWDNKDSLIVVIDCSREMFEKTRGEIPFQLCIKVHNNSLLFFFVFFIFLYFLFLEWSQFTDDHSLLWSFVTPSWLQCYQNEF